MLGQWVGDHDLNALLVDTAARQEDIAAIQKYAPSAISTAEKFDHQLYKGIVLRAFGVLNTLLENYESALENLNQALDIFHKMETRWQLGRTLENLATLERRRKNKLMEKKYLNQAWEEFKFLRALPDMGRIQKKLEEL